LAARLTPADAGVKLKSPNEKLDIGCIGTGGGWRADYDVHELAAMNATSWSGAQENIVALCDVDANYLNAMAQRFPGARLYKDYRVMLDKEKTLDAVGIAIPDHQHGPAAMMAMALGRHVYCEKPLTRTVSECRIVRELAKGHHCVTQLGTQIHALTNYRRVVELIQTGAIGQVREVHVWSSAVYGNLPVPTDRPPVPLGLHWDLWLGPVEPHPYHPDYAPAKWRNWWAFGGGTLADFGCHFMDLPHWALNLRYPLSIEPVDGPPVNPESPPPWLIVRYQHPARPAARGTGTLPPVTLTWYQGGKQPALLDEEQRTYFKSGVLFVGEKGRLLADYTRRQLLPEAEFAGFKAPEPFIPNSVGHHKEWIEAIKTGGPTTCNFDYSGALTEAALLGNVAYRAGRRLEWDAAKLRATNAAGADQFIQHHYRAGWSL